MYNDVKLKPCPFCGYNEFDIFDNCDSQATAIYCKNCPGGVEDHTKTIVELIEI